MRDIPYADQKLHDMPRSQETPEGMMSAACNMAIAKVMNVLNDPLAWALLKNLIETGVV